MSLGDSLGVLSNGYMPSIILAITAVLLFIHQRLSLKLDPREPPILKPKVPYIGHIIGLFRYHSAYFDRLYARKPMPIATLPMLNGKLYMITDPVMVQNAFRNKKLSFDPFTLEVAQRMLGVSDQTMIPVRFAGDGEKPGFLAEFVQELHGAMTSQYLPKMNANALNGVAITINGLGETSKIDNLYYWIRDTMTVATCDALFGSHNPVKAGSDFVQALWDFEAGILGILMNVFPSVIVPKAFKARAKLQKALIKYYSAKHDLEPDVSQLAKVRAGTMRKRGIADEDIGKFELALLHVSTANAIPTLFWHLCFISAEPETTSIIRTELESIITTTTLENGKREASIDTTKFDSNCPVLVSSYRETIRLANAQVGARRVVEDTLVNDGKNEYLLKAGCDVQLPAGISHLSEAAWGTDAVSFNPNRFLTPEQRGDVSTRARIEDREQKKSYIPFGGGKHLCPGRQFAFAEILGAVAVLVMGFDVKGSDGGLIKVPVMGRSRMGEGVAKPTGEGLLMGANITRREGREDIVWKFTC